MLGALTPREHGSDGSEPLSSRPPAAVMPRLGQPLSQAPLLTLVCCCLGTGRSPQLDWVPHVDRDWGCLGYCGPASPCVAQSRDSLKCLLGLLLRWPPFRVWRWEEEVVLESA